MGAPYQHTPGHTNMKNPGTNRVKVGSFKFKLVYTKEFLSQNTIVL